MLKIYHLYRPLLTLIICFGSVTISNPLQAQSSGIPALDTLLNNTLDSMRTLMNAKSLNAAVQFPDSAVWTGATGISAAGVPAGTQQAYLIGSVTKTITSACILSLVDDGILSLDDSLHEWLDTMVYVHPDLTIRQLLRHQSGLFDILYHPGFQPAMNANPGFSWPADSLIKTFILPPTGTPGGAWNYCNTNYFLLGLVIESATGQPFWTEIRNRFFSALGYTTFGIPAWEVYAQPVAHVWIDLNGDGVLDDGHNYYYNFLALNSAAGAAGGYYATAGDLARWTRTYLRGDIVSAAMMTEATTMINASGSQGGKYGLGLMRNIFQGLTAYGHGGDLAYAASSWYFPAKDISISVLMNQNGLTSWNLLPVVNALLKTYNTWLLTTSVNDAQPPQNFTVYPNPFSEEIHVTMNGIALTGNPDVSLYNPMGQLITSQTFISETIDGYAITLVPASDLKPGIYVLQISTDGRPVGSVKVVKHN